jgi:hypothetical protein
MLIFIYFPIIKREILLDYGTYTGFVVKRTELTGQTIVLYGLPLKGVQDFGLQPDPEVWERLRANVAA